jgi:hypothetical protein
MYPVLVINMPKLLKVSKTCEDVKAMFSQMIVKFPAKTPNWQGEDHAGNCTLWEPPSLVNTVED